MKYLCISGCVMVTGPPAAICFLNSGITLPLLPNTLPKRTETNRVPLFCNEFTASSASLLVTPMMLVGRTALSVEIITKSSSPCSAAPRAVLYVPNTLFSTASNMCASIIGTCL